MTKTIDPMTGVAVLVAWISTVLLCIEYPGLDFVLWGYSFDALGGASTYSIVKWILLQIPILMWILNRLRYNISFLAYYSIIRHRKMRVWWSQEVITICIVCFFYSLSIHIIVGLFYPTFTLPCKEAIKSILLYGGNLILICSILLIGYVISYKIELPIILYFALHILNGLDSVNGISLSKYNPVNWSMYVHLTDFDGERNYAVYIILIQFVLSSIIFMVSYKISKSKGIINRESMLHE